MAHKVLGTLSLLILLALAGCTEREADPDWTVAGTPIFGFIDAEGDVTGNGYPNGYSGSDEGALDVVRVQLYDGDAVIVLHLDLAGLETIVARNSEPGYHVQYALSWKVDGEGEGFSARATYDGPDRSPHEAGGWRFQLHQKGPDDWPSVAGEVDDSTLRWSIPYAMFGATNGTTLTDWHVSTWASMNEGSQYGDSASSSKTITLGMR